MTRGREQWIGGALLLLTFCSGCSKESTKGAPAGPDDSQAADSEPQLLAAGADAPLFSATAHSGEKVELAKLRGKKVVLYFYPKDNTPGCTVEAHGFRDEHEKYKSRNTVVIGVSTQNNESHREFATEHDLPFLLIPDEDRAIATSYGVGSRFGLSQRVTFLISPSGKIAKVYDQVVPEDHADELLEDLNALNL